MQAKLKKIQVEYQVTIKGKQEYRSVEVELPQTLEDVLILYGTKEVFRVFIEYLVRKEIQSARHSAKSIQPLIDELEAQKDA